MYQSFTTMQKFINYLFHLYQPPWQERNLLLTEYHKTYLPLVKILQKDQHLKLTLNLTGSLTELLLKEDSQEFFTILRELVERGQVELTGCAMYHPLLPLIPTKEIVRQIQLNEKINSNALGSVWYKSQTAKFGRGFFLPELAYGAETAKIVKEMGFNWLAIDQSSLVDTTPDWSQHYIDKASGLRLLINNRIFQTKSSARFNDQYNILISDAENQITSQNMEINWNSYLFYDLHGQEISYLTTNEYFAKIAKNETQVQLRPSTWQTSEEDFKSNDYYALWDKKDNLLHKALWDFVTDITKVIENHQHDSYYSAAHEEFDHGLSSCTWWWIDGRISGYNPTNISKGLEFLINSIRTLKELNFEQRISFEKRYTELVYLIWEKHWKNLTLIQTQ
jgi:predicted glycosyl hydrolase (DUF1957 family)